jgi:hypothetical protein
MRSDAPSTDLPVTPVEPTDYYTRHCERHDRNWDVEVDGACRLCSRDLLLLQMAYAAGELLVHVEDNKLRRVALK